MDSGVTCYSLFLIPNGTWVECFSDSWDEKCWIEDNQGPRRFIQEFVLVDVYRQVNPRYAALLFKVAGKPVIRELKSYCDLSKLPIRVRKETNGFTYLEPDPYAPIDPVSRHSAHGRASEALAPTPPAELPELVAAGPPSGDWIAATNGGTSEAAAELTFDKIILDKSEVNRIAGIALLFVQSAAELKIRMCAGDAPASLSQYAWYARCADGLDHVLDPKRWEWMLEFPFCLVVERDLHALGLGFAAIKHDSGLRDANLSNFPDPTWDDVEPLFDGHEDHYRSLFASSARLLASCGSTMETGPNPFEPSDDAPIIPPEPNGRIPEAPADRPELVAAATPSGDGTAATEAPTNSRAPEPLAKPTPPARAIAAAYQLLREGKPVSLKAACKRAGVDRANLRKLHPEAVETIAKMAAPDRKPPRAIHDRRTGNSDALDETDD